MIDQNIDSQQFIPLHRLLNQREAKGLLKDFEQLLPHMTLALVGADGRHFAATAEWSLPDVVDQAELADLLAQARAGQALRKTNLQIHPLFAGTQFVGGLVLHPAQSNSDQHPASEDVLRCLLRSLKMVLIQALEKREIVRETLERYREINLLYHVGETIGACLNPNEIPELMLTEAKRVIQFDAGMVLLPAAESNVSLEVKTVFGPTRVVEELHQASQLVINQVRQTGRPDILSPSATDGASIGAILCAPMKAQDRVLGVVLLGRVKEQAIFTASDEKLVMALASQAAIAIEKAWLHRHEVDRQRLEEELALSRQIQLSLLPESCPTLPGWEFAAIYQAARQIGGDLYDFFDLPGESHRLGLVIADVTGKGVPAALFMAFSRTIIRTESMSGRNPAAVLEQANRIIVQDNRAKLLLSAFYATLDLGTGRLVYANAGHHWPLLQRFASGEIKELKVRGIILGAFDDIALEEREIEVSPGDNVIFFTDGVIEAMDAGRRMFGEERLHEVVTAHSTSSANQILRAVVDAVKDFVGDVPLSDDFTLFVVKRQKEGLS